jgi:hypothetical protein
MVVLTWMSEEDLIELQGSKILSDMKERALGFADPFKKVLLSISEDTTCWHGRLSYWPSEPWDNRDGTVTLAGDAAHPMTFRKQYILFHPNPFPPTPISNQQPPNPHHRPWPRPQQRHRRLRPTPPPTPIPPPKSRLQFHLHLLPTTLSDSNRTLRNHEQIRRRSPAARPDCRPVLSRE